MCNVAPGARCSGHTQTQLENKRGARQKVQDKLDAAVTAAAKAGAAGRDASFRKFNNAAKMYQSRLDVLDVEIKHVQRDYDGTPKGKEELQAILENPETSPADYNDAIGRLNKGGALRSLRTNLLSINQAPGRRKLVRQALLGLDGGEFSEERTVAVA